MPLPPPYGRPEELPAVDSDTLQSILFPTASIEDEMFQRRMRPRPPVEYRSTDFPSRDEIQFQSRQIVDPSVIRPEYASQIRQRQGITFPLPASMAEWQFDALLGRHPELTNQPLPSPQDPLSQEEIDKINRRIDAYTQMENRRIDDPNIPYTRQPRVTVVVKPPPVQWQEMGGRKGYYEMTDTGPVWVWDSSLSDTLRNMPDSPDPQRLVIPPPIRNDSLFREPGESLPAPPTRGLPPRYPYLMRDNEGKALDPQPRHIINPDGTFSREMYYGRGLGEWHTDANGNFVYKEHIPPLTGPQSVPIPPGHRVTTRPDGTLALERIKPPLSTAGKAIVDSIDTLKGIQFLMQNPTARRFFLEDLKWKYLPAPTPTSREFDQTNSLFRPPDELDWTIPSPPRPR